MTRTYWLSFVDPDAAIGHAFLGVAVVDVSTQDAAVAKRLIARKYPHAQRGAEWVAAAIRRTWESACNPGGEVATVRLTAAELAAGPTIPRNRLLSKADLLELGLIPAAE